MSGPLRCASPGRATYIRSSSAFLMAADRLCISRFAQPPARRHMLPRLMSKRNCIYAMCSFSARARSDWFAFIAIPFCSLITHISNLSEWRWKEGERGATAKHRVSEMGHTSLWAILGAYNVRSRLREYSDGFNIRPEKITKKKTETASTHTLTQQTCIHTPHIALAELVLFSCCASFGWFCSALSSPRAHSAECLCCVCFFPYQIKLKFSINMI